MAGSFDRSRTAPLESETLAHAEGLRANGLEMQIVSAWSLLLSCFAMIPRGSVQCVRPRSVPNEARSEESQIKVRDGWG